MTGVVLHSDIQWTGHFACSNPLLKQLQHNSGWSQKSNFMESAGRELRHLASALGLRRRREGASTKPPSDFARESDDHCRKI